MRDHLLGAANRSPADYTEIRFHRQQGVRLALSRRQPEAPIHRVQSGGVVRCISRGTGWGSASFHDLGELPSAIQQAHEMSLLLRPAQAMGPVPPAARQAEWPCPSGRHPGAIPMAAKGELIAAAAAAIHDADRRIVDSRLVYRDVLEEIWVVSSAGTCLMEQRPTLELAALAVAEEEGTQERALGSRSAPGVWFDLEEWVGTLGEIASRAVSLLRAVPVRPARVPVVLDPATAGLLAHRALGHACLADRWEGGDGPLALGTRVGPPSLTVGDDGRAPGLRGTLAFDFEGLEPRNTVMVQGGVVVGHLHTLTSSCLAGTAPTGNARGAWDGPPRASLTNTYIAQGQRSLSELLGDISSGLYLADPVAVSLDGGRLGIRAGHARMIRGGHLAEPVRGAVLGGDALALLGLVDRPASDFRWDTSASWCRGGGGDLVPVSTGAPHLRLVEADVTEQA